MFASLSLKLATHTPIITRLLTIFLRFITNNGLEV